VPAPLPSPRLRARAEHRPQTDPACAGCPQLGLLRALRRVGIEAGGRLGCEPGDGQALAEGWRGEGGVLVLAGPEDPPLRELAGWPDEVARVERVSPDALPDVEAALVRALAGRGLTLLVAVAPCQLGAPRAPPLAIDPARCNRCGACLALGCPAIADVGGEAMVVDGGICTGCERCVPLCRGRAIQR
jgi:TPP-dependent indolepyruvate ferredoxin oxidoreductase alpha subunit